MLKTLKEWKTVIEEVKTREGRSKFNFSYDFYGALELAKDILEDWQEQNNKLVLELLNDCEDG